MTRLLILVEGQSEEIFVKKILAPHLENYGVYVEAPIVIWTKRMSDGGGFRGGVCNWSQILKTLRPLTRDGDAWITTLFDFYGLPEDFPGYLDARSSNNPYDAIVQLQNEFERQIAHPRLIPFIALHEFESWIFCAPSVVANHFGNQHVELALVNAVSEAGSPELINHGPTTHPKERLKRLGVGYKETSDGPTLIEKIGIQTIKENCAHFSTWLDRLENLAVVN